MVLRDARHNPFSAYVIERRPRGASRAALAPTFVSGQLVLEDLRADALAHVAISRRTNKAVARACYRRYWPETNVGDSMVEGKSQGDIPLTVSTDFQAQAYAPGISSDVWLPVAASGAAEPPPSVSWAAWPLRHISVATSRPDASSGRTPAGPDVGRVSPGPGSSSSRALGDKRRTASTYRSERRS